MNDFDDLDQLERDFGPALRTGLREIASQVKPNDVPRLDSGEILTGYVGSPSVERLPSEESTRGPRRGALLIGALAVAAAVVAVAILNRPSQDASPIQSPTTTSAPASSTTTSPPVPTQFKSSSFLLDVATGTRSPLPAGLVEGFSLSDMSVSDYVPSPDGTRVVAWNWCASGFNTCASADRFAVGNIDGSNVRAITPPEGRHASEFGWSPDGTKIVYRATANGIDNDLGELVVEDVTTGAQTQITHLERGATNGAFPVAPAFTADGQTVLFMLPTPSRGGSDVWSVPVTGGEPTLVIEDAAFPAPLPDGKTIAYVRVGIRVASIDDPGSARHLATTSRTGVFGLAASPDGTRLIYGRPGGLDPGGTNVVDVATGEMEQVLDGASAAWLDNDTLIVTQFAPDDD